MKIDINLSGVSSHKQEQIVDVLDVLMCEWAEDGTPEDVEEIVFETINEILER